MKQQRKFYLYRFINDKDEIIYIGRTNDIRRRIITEHFTNNTHLPNECYNETQRVEYAEFANESEEVAYEAILINQEKPKYNTQFKDSAKFDVKIPLIEWKSFEWDFEGQMEIMKGFKNEYVSISDALCKCIFDKSSLKYFTHGFPSIDMSTAIPPYSMTLIAGVSGTFKTSYGLQIARENALRDNKKVLYINLKDSTESLMSRLISMEARIKTERLYKSRLTKNDWENIAVAGNMLENAPIFFYNRANAGCSLDSIENAIVKSQCDMVIIDDINSISDFENTYLSDKCINAMNQLKKISLETGCLIISLYSLKSKDIITRTDKRPMLSDLPYTSLMSYNDLIEFLYVREYDLDIFKPLEVIIAKNPSSVSTSVLLTIDTSNGRLMQVEKNNDTI
ncbi:MAG: GIY-YIG nuclease family protein [Ruminococcus sp.]|nr:GIY-YIG nuclease family protein [Ruminococcus sp.]